MNKYYDDSSLIEFQANVVSSHKEDHYFWIALDNTAFFVESGGMLSDTGTLNNLKVLEIKNIDGIIFHKVEQLLSGKVVGIIEQKQRLIKTQVHTAQHLLSYLFKKYHNANTTSHHHLSEGSDIEFDILDITYQQLTFIQDEANRLINDNLAVNISYQKDQLRVVSIGDYDSDFCCCLHVKSTADIKLILITGYYKVKNGIRIEYLAGDEILDYLQIRLPILNNLSKELSLPHLDLLSGVYKLKEQQKEVRDKLRQSKEHYIRLLADNTIKELDLSKLNYIVQDFSDLDVKELQTLANHYKHNQNVIVFLQGNINNKGAIVIAKHKDLDSFDIKQAFEYFKANYNYRGGGNDVMIQANGDLISDFENVIKSSFLGV